MRSKEREAAGVEFSGDYTDPVSGTRVSVTIEVPDAQFDAAVDWSVMGAVLDWVGARRGFERPIVRAAHRAMSACVRQIRERWVEVNPNRGHESPVPAIGAVMVDGGRVVTCPNPRYAGPSRTRTGERVPR